MKTIQFYKHTREFDDSWIIIQSNSFIVWFDNKIIRCIHFWCVYKLENKYSKILVLWKSNWMSCLYSSVCLKVTLCILTPDFSCIAACSYLLFRSKQAKTRKFKKVLLKYTVMRRWLEINLNNLIFLFPFF